MAANENPIQVAGIVGSLRKGSYNRLLYQGAVALAPIEMSFIEQQIGGLPLFDDDLEANTPAAVESLRQAVRKADALLIVSPEYNYSIPGPLKNAIDWLSRPSGQSVLAHKPVAIMGAASGRSGTMRAQLHLRQVLTACNMDTVSRPEVVVPFASEKFDDDGLLTDSFTRDAIIGLLAALERTVQDRRLIAEYRTD